MMFVIFCPDYSTGGPFALLQLNQALLDLGFNSKVLFYDKAEIRFDSASRRYDVIYSQPINIEVPFARYETCTCFDEDAVLVFPEILLGWARRFHAYGHRRKVYWWLSWDNAPLGELNKFEQKLALLSCFHIFQSEYARRQASALGFRGPIVSDWTLPQEHVHGDEGFEKTNDICFLPAKAQGTERVIAALEQEFSVIPIRDMTRFEVSQVLRKSLVFLDFGQQPGKDRLPREAVLHDCIPVLRKTGAAVSFMDFPIPENLKIGIRTMASSQDLRELIRLIHSRHQDVLVSLQPFKEAIRHEKTVFYEQVRSLCHVLATDPWTA
jgi:hypothetical protein